MKRLIAVLLLAVILSGCSQIGAMLGIDITMAPVPDPEIVPYRDMRYFLNTLDEESFANFCALYEAALEHKSTCRLPYPVNSRRLEIVMYFLHYECPELMHLDFYKGYTYFSEDSLVERVQLSYCMDQETYRSCKAASEAVLEEMAQLTRGMTDREKEWAVYHYIADRCTYSNTAGNVDNAYGALVEGYAECDGIAMALKWGLEYVGVPCAVIAGDLPGKDTGHAWNLVCLDGQWYDVDLTGDVGEGEKWYGAYNVSDSWIRDLYLINAEFSYFSTIPGSATMEESYHAQAGSLVTAQTDIDAALLDSYNTGKAVLFQFIQTSECEAFQESLEQRLNDLVQTYSLETFRWQYAVQQDYKVISVRLEKQ